MCEFDAIILAGGLCHRGQVGRHRFLGRGHRVCLEEGNEPVEWVGGVVWMGTVGMSWLLSLCVCDCGV